MVYHARSWRLSIESPLLGLRVTFEGVCVDSELRHERQPAGTMTLAGEECNCEVCKTSVKLSRE